METKKGKENRSFDGVHFKINIPILTSYFDRTDFSITYFNTEKEMKICSVLEKCSLVDKLERATTSKKDHYCLFGLNNKKPTQIISIPTGQNQLLLKDSVIDFVFLCSNEKKVTVSYRIDANHKLNLLNVAVCQMTKKEIQKAGDIINSFASRRDDGKSGEERKDDETKEKYTHPSICEYSNALKREISFLKQGKGKKHKIYNGTKVNKDKGVFSYSFEMETELHLPDDSPVVIDTNMGLHGEGTVLFCEDFQIMLLVDCDLGERILFAFLGVEPWKLLEKLDERLNELVSGKNRLAIDIIERGANLSTTKDVALIPKGQDKVSKQLKSNDIVVVWGPPGTGKTYTMAKIATEYVNRGKSVLIVSHSNVSVDGVIKSVVEMAEKTMQSYLADGKIFRFGYIRDAELSKHPYASSFNFALSKCPQIANELGDLYKKREKFKAENKTKTSDYDINEKRIKKCRDDIRKEERKYVERALLVGTTISKVTIDPMFQSKQYDLVMFDEVSMAYVPQVLVAASLAKEKFMCVGDFKQLPPISQNPTVKEILQTDIFSYIKIADKFGNMYFHPWLVLLNEQRRMHPAISEFPNKIVYKNLLVNHESVIQEREKIVKENPLPNDALNLIDLAWCYCAASKNTENSRYNILSAIVSFLTAVKAEKTGTETVGIITPYAAQTRLIRAMIRDYYEEGTKVISCATVHQFQGSESDVIIFDAVESYPSSRVGFLMGKNPNEVVRLINVAVTRAKGKLITVANAQFWENAFKGTNHIFYKLLNHIKKNHTVKSSGNKELISYLKDISEGKKAKVFCDENDAWNMIKQDVIQSKGKIVISVPYGKLYESAKEILELLVAADRRGVDILMKTNDYENLPDGWKKFCWGTENAIFPLIVIDDEILWYGLPTSPLPFQIEKTKKQNTVTPVIIRYKGKNTIEMIKSLTELEIISVGKEKKPLVRKGKYDIGAKAEKTYDFSTFVKEKKFCPECKKSMSLAKNRYGKAYLKCSNGTCKHVEYLGADLMNWYILVRNVKCPQNDGGELMGMIGKYGPCIKCDRGHFLKPDEI